MTLTPVWLCIVEGIFVIAVSASNGDFTDGVLLTPSRVYLQAGRTQRLTCPALTQLEQGGGAAGGALLITFHRVTPAADGGHRRELLLRYAHPLSGGNFSAGPRYRFAPDFGLVLASVAASDAGGYQCLVVTSDAAQNIEGTIDVTVLEDRFPADRGQLAEGRNLTVSEDEATLSLPCPVNGTASLHRPTIYWSEEDEAEAGAAAEAEAGAGAEAEAAETDIVAALFSDGESTSQRGFSVSPAGALTVSSAGQWRRRGLWCHVSSAEDRFFLTSAKVSLHKPEVSKAVLVLLLSVFMAIGLAILGLVCIVRARRVWKKGSAFYVSLPVVTGPEIDSGSRERWSHDFLLGARGKLGNRAGGAGAAGVGFRDLKSVQPVHLRAQHGREQQAGLAVLDADGVHVFGPDFRPRARSGSTLRLRQPGRNYAAMAVQGSGERERLLLGARDGTISSLDLTTGTETALCSLRDCDGEGASPRRHCLTDLAVDKADYIYAGDEATNQILVFYSEGDLMRSHKLSFSPGVLAARDAGECFVHSGDGDQPIAKVIVTVPEPVWKVFAKGQRLLRPTNLVVEGSRLYVVNDIRCQGQREILQFDERGNYVRQFAKPWPGLRGLRSLPAGKCLALYDSSTVRIYTLHPHPANDP